MRVTLSINGDVCALESTGPEGPTVRDALGAALGAELAAAGARGVAVAVNGRVVRRAEWGERTLAQGDRVEIIRAVQGG
ncbi:MAG: sulfur carrier protein ThiS [Myxococcota bacterium]